MSAPMFPMTRRRYLTLEAVMAGAPIFIAIEAVSSTALEHPEWNMDELVDERGHPVEAVKED